MNKRVVGWGFVLAVLFCLCATCSSAQNVTGSIQGTIVDSAGGAVPNASVTISNTDQNIVVRTVTTDEHGEYVVPQLPVGRYSVTVETKGFKKVVHSGIVLNVGDKVAVNFTLVVGTVSEIVSVQSDAVRVIPKVRPHPASSPARSSRSFLSTAATTPNSCFSFPAHPTPVMPTRFFPEPLRQSEPTSSLSKSMAIAAKKTTGRWMARTMWTAAQT